MLGLRMAAPPGRRTRGPRIDLMPDVAYTAERDAVFDFPVTPVLHSWSQVLPGQTSPSYRCWICRTGAFAMLGGGVQVDAFKTMVVDLA